MPTLYWCLVHGEWTQDSVIEAADDMGNSIWLCPVCKKACSIVEIYGGMGPRDYQCPKCKWGGIDPEVNIITKNDLPDGWELACPECGTLVHLEEE